MVAALLGLSGAAAMVALTLGEYQQAGYDRLLASLLGAVGVFLLGDVWDRIATVAAPAPSP